MGMMPPWDPFQETNLLWAKVKILDCKPFAPTWTNPATVTVEVLEALGGSKLPATLHLPFGQPREAGQAYFYEMRAGSFPPPGSLPPVGGPTPPPSPLDGTPIEVPTIGDVVWIWLEPSPTPGQFEVPSARLLGAYPELPFHSRWLEDTAAARTAILRAIKR